MCKSKGVQQSQTDFSSIQLFCYKTQLWLMTPLYFVRFIRQKYVWILPKEHYGQVNVIRVQRMEKTLCSQSAWKVSKMVFWGVMKVNLEHTESIYKEENDLLSSRANNMSKSLRGGRTWGGKNRMYSGTQGTRTQLEWRALGTRQSGSLGGETITCHHYW